MAAIALLGTAIYSNTFAVPFVFDDQWNISENSHIRVTELDPAKLWQAFTLSPNASRPVAHFSFVLNYYFGGYDVAGYHVVNLVVHIVNGILIYFLSRFTLDRLAALSPSQTVPHFDRQLKWLALAAACIFVAHPLQTQSVTYVVQRMTSMASLFYLLSLWLYILGRVEKARGRRTAYWIGGAVSFLFAVGTKQIAATLPLAILLYEWFFFQDLNTEWARRRLKYLIAAGALFVVVGIIYLGQDPLQRLFADYQRRDFTLAERLLTQPSIVWFYISLLLYPNPTRLNLLHDFTISHSLVDPPTTLVAILGIAGLITLAVLIARRERLFSFCILWFFLHLAIESSIIPLELVFEHRVYLPMWGFAMAVPFLVYRLLARQPYAVTAVCSLLIAACAVGSFERNKAWADEITLWSDVIAKNPQAHRAFNNRGIIYKAQGKMELALKDYDAAVQLEPLRSRSYYNRANAYQALGKLDLALADYNKALEIRPNYAASLSNRGNIYLAQGKKELALADYNRAIELKPNLVSAYLGRANAHRHVGNLELALRDCSKAIELEPRNAAAYSNRGILHSEMNNYPLALADYNRAIELEPGYIPAYQNRAQANSSLRKFGLVATDYKRIVAHRPNDPDALNNLAWQLATCPDPKLRDGRAAVAFAQRATQLTRGRRYEILSTLAAAHAEAGNFPEAVRWQKAALEKSPESDRPELNRQLILFESGRPFHTQANP